MKKRTITIKINLIERCDKCNDVIDFSDELSLFRVSNIIDDLNKGKPVRILCPACGAEAIFDDYRY
jgi:hypothetical protein